MSRNHNRRKPEKNMMLNDAIRASEVFLIDENGTQIGAISKSEALAKARNVALDLYCVSPNANPPVCKILDYGKLQYELKKKTKENKKNQTIIEVKEIRLRPNIGDHDLETKANNAKKFLEKGNKIKVSLSYRGREMAHKELGFETMNKFKEIINEYCEIEKAPFFEGRFLNMYLKAKK